MPKKTYTQRPDGRYQAKVYLGNGKYKYVYAKSVKELDTAVLEIKLQMHKGIDVAPERDSFADWAEYYLRQRELDHARGDLTQSRLNITRSRLRDLEPLNALPLTKIRTRDIQEIIDSKAMEGASVSVLKDIKAAARHVFDLAVNNRVIGFNPADTVKIPTDKHREPKRRALTPEEQGWIEQSEHRCKRAAMIMMHAGLRRGELIPLLWRDIDLKSRCIDVNKTVEFIGGRPVVKPYGKSAAAIRKVYIPKRLADYLSEEKEKDSSSLLVCPDAGGRMLTDIGYRRLWQSFMHYLNYTFGDFSCELDPEGGAYKLPKSRFAPKKIPTVIPPFTAHWLRHTFITNMYFAGIDVLTAKEQAGHADIKTTMEIYTHLDAVHKRRQIDKLDAYFDPKPAEKIGTGT